ncbi:twinstar-like protein [Leptotrombidium deliense]|uniref:Twinstar-like protein n=1 Tax=Leptotrombidium deliense TaxID=299467 RepID=A0A443RX30_9ACAR|nr:twinstar-like protein [Leptotrombidium deliense]
MYIIMVLNRFPDEAKVKQKMLYSCSFDALKRALVGIYKYMQACDLDEASLEAVEQKVKFPDEAKVKQKMVYSCSLDTLKSALVGICKYMKACDLDEASLEAVEQKVKSSMWRN